MDTLLIQKRSLFSELKRNHGFHVFILTASVLISIFGIFPFIGYIFHRYSLPLDTSVQLGDTNVGYFDFLLSGFIVRKEK